MTVSAPSRSDAVARLSSAVIGGPAGRRVAAATGVFYAVPVLMVLAAVMLSFGVLQKQHCRAAGWSTPDQFWHVCYSDIPVLYSSAGLGGSPRPSLFDVIGAGTPSSLGQPPLTGAAMWLMSTLVDSSPSAAAPGRFFDLSAVVMAGLLLITVTAVALAAGQRRRWDAAHVALAPVLFTAALVSYDLLAVAFCATAILAWARRRPAVSGLFLGLAVASRPLTAVVAVAILGICVRSGRVRAWGILAGSAAGVWVVVRLVLFPSPFAALSSAWQTWRDSPPGYGSLWLVPSLVRDSSPVASGISYTGPVVSSAMATTLTILSLLIVALVTLLVALTTRHRPRLAHLALFATAGALLATKSLPVQAGLLLLPLVALAGLRWRDHLIWAGAEVAYFVGVWLYIAAGSDANKGLPAGFYLILLLVRRAAIAWLAVQALRAAVNPLLDPVRVPTDPAERDHGQDDPLAGVTADVPDALIVRLT